MDLKLGTENPGYKFSPQEVKPYNLQPSPSHVHVDYGERFRPSGVNIPIKNYTHYSAYHA